MMITFRYLVFILVMLISASLSCIVIWGTPAPDYYYAYLAAPWVLLLTSIKGWHKAFIWRRMFYMRGKPPTLSRGSHRVEQLPPRPGILERMSASLLLLAIAAILHQQNIPNIPWWIAAIIGSWLLMRLALKGMR